MGRQLKLTLESDNHEVIEVEDDFSLEALLLDAETPATWIVFPTEGGGAFSVKSGSLRAAVLAADD